jgi:hypothetical protein
MNISDAQQQGILQDVFGILVISKQAFAVFLSVGIQDTNSSSISAVRGIFDTPDIGWLKLL